jgi:hypothetical protein
VYPRAAALGAPRSAYGHSVCVPSPLLAASSGADAIIDLFVVLVAAKVGQELATRIGQPALFVRSSPAFWSGRRCGLVELTEVGST